MALPASTYQFLNQQAFLRLVDPSAGPDGPHGTVAFWLVPTGGYFAGQRAPHQVTEDLKAESYDTQVIEGVEYYLVPEESTNLPGRLSHYAQLTGVAELQNPSGGGVNRVRETFTLTTAKATVAPDAVAKYVEDNDSWEEARQKQAAQDAQVDRAVNQAPAREPAEGKLVEGVKPEKTEKSTPASRPAKPNEKP